MTPEMEKNTKVGMFVTFGITLTLLAIFVLGGSENAFTSKTEYHARFLTASGLMNGSKVMLSGMPVGNISDIDYEPDSQKIKVAFKIERKFSNYIKSGSRVEVLTQGMLGDKYLSIDPGAGADILPESSELEVKTGQDLQHFVSKSDQLLISLTSAAQSLDRILKQLEKGNRLDSITINLQKISHDLAQVTQDPEMKSLPKVSKQLQEILSKINNGTGTLGALVNDPSLYDDVRSIVGGANRNRILRNLVRKTAQDGAEAGEK